MSLRLYFFCNIFSIIYVISDIYGNFNIFSTQKCSFQPNLLDKFSVNGTKHKCGPLISLIILATEACPVHTIHHTYHLSIDLTKYLKLWFKSNVTLVQDSPAD